MERLLEKEILTALLTRVRHFTYKGLRSREKIRKINGLENFKDGNKYFFINVVTRTCMKTFVLLQKIFRC